MRKAVDDVRREGEDRVKGLVEGYESKIAELVKKYEDSIK